MKRHLLFVTLALLIAGTAVAQPASSMCVYFDADGTTSVIGTGESFPTYAAYVIIFVEDAVTGASFQANLTNHPTIGAGLLYAGYSNPPGLAIGDPLAPGGVEIGFAGTYYGFLGVPVVVCTLQFVNLDFPATPYDSRIFLTPHMNYGDLVYGDGTGAIQTLVTCAEAVSNDDSSFGQIKSMFR